MAAMTALGAGAFLTTPDIDGENRAVATLPALSAGLESVPDGFQAFLDDHVPGRAWMLTTHALWKTTVLGTSPTPKVMLGRDGWLYLGDDVSRQCLRADEPWNPNRRSGWVRVVAGLHHWLAQRNTVFLFVVAPAKSTIYPEHAPRGIQAVGTSRIDELYAQLAGFGVPVVDLRPSLRAAKSEGEVYQHLDTHWNSDGSYVAYVDIVQALRRLVPAVPEPNPPTAFERSDAFAKSDLAQAMALDGILRETVPTRRLVEPRARLVGNRRDADHEKRLHLTYEVDDAALPKAVVFRDSFGTLLVDDLAEHFRSTEFVWTIHPDLDVVRSLGPEVVIYEVAERFLYGGVPRVDGVEAARQ